MAELTHEQFEAANELGRIIRATQPHAKAARYDPKTAAARANEAEGGRPRKAV